MDFKYPLLLLIGMRTCLRPHKAHADTHTQSHTHSRDLPYKSEEQMSSVTDQLRRNVGKSRNTAVGEDKEMCGAERKGDRQGGGERDKKSEEG